MNAHGGPHGRLDFETETFVAAPYTLAIRGRGDSHDLEYRQDGTANAILTPNGGRAGIGVGAIAFDCKAGGDTSFAIGDVPGTLRGEGHGGGHAAIAYALRSDAGREGEAKTPSADADGRVRLRDPGFTIYEEHAPTLDASAAHSVATGWAVRRLTPLECERLQGFPDGYTEIPRAGGKSAADGPRYKALGNSMAVNVMRWIGQRIEMVDAIPKVSV